MLLTRICIGDTNTLHNLDRKNMREYLTLAEYESFFIFDKVTYRKIGGAAISSQLGPFLRMHIYFILKNSGFHNVTLVFYTKFIKDVLMIFL